MDELAHAALAFATIDKRVLPLHGLDARIVTGSEDDDGHQDASGGQCHADDEEQELQDAHGGPSVFQVNNRATLFLQCCQIKLS